MATRTTRKDAIALLKDDHREVKALFRRFEQAGERAHATKRKIVDTITEELSRHAAIEEEIFYPAVRERIGDTEDDVLEALEEHHLVKIVLSELEGMEPSDERFDAKVTVLIENVRHHIEEEEGDMFKRVRSAFSRQELLDLARWMQNAKAVAPTHPHPRAPDEPPGNLLAKPAAMALDAGKDVVRAVRRRVAG